MQTSSSHDLNAPVALGIDVGSVAAKLVVADPQGNILWRRYRRTQGRVVETTHALLEEALAEFASQGVALAAATGSGARLICEVTGIEFVNELISLAVAIKRLNPPVQTLIEMGGQDSKILFLPTGDGRGQPMLDFAMNTNCAAGTGSFLDQQASRLGIRIEEQFGQIALASTNPPRVAGRCSVFAKSDMIHLQQQATPVADILMGLCLGLARNLKSNLGQGHEFVRPMAFCGGVAANRGVVRALEEVFELGPGGLIVPHEHAVTAAYGAVLVKQREGRGRPLPENALDALRARSIEEQVIGHRLRPLKPAAKGCPESTVYRPQMLSANGNGDPIPAYLGLDVGSISTKIAIIDDENRVLAKSYLMTAGRPLEAVRQCLTAIGEQVGDRVEIIGAASTGSGRYLTGDFIGADLIINEITAQAYAAALIDPQVDTIFEIGGQDSKYISLDNGVVVDFEMNHACAAGTGSFLEEQAERLGIRIEEQFANLALGSQAPIRLGERCTVFMESDLLSHQQQGADTDDLVAGLSYSIVTNYINRVVGHRRIGERIFFQGGTAFNKAVVAAFEAITAKPITVPPHHEVTGSIGAAALARKYQQENKRTQSNFRGFDLARMEYNVRTFECDGCENQCEIKEVTMPGREPLYYGSRCDRYNVKKKTRKGPRLPKLFAERHKLLLRHAHLKPKPQNGTRTVGIPLALSNYQLLPFWGTLLGELGLQVVVTAQSTKELVRRGVEAVVSTPCFPVKVAHGHVLELIDRQVDYIWLPSVISMDKEFPQSDRNQLCPYIQTIPYQVAVALEPGKAGVKLLKPPVRFQDGPKMLLRCLEPLCKEFAVSRSKLAKALRAAQKAQQAFHADCLQLGRRVLANLDPNRRNVVVISRPYNGCDPGVSLDLPKKLRDLGVLAIPMDLLDLSEGDVPGDKVFSNMYWKYGQRILRAATIVRSHPRLHAVYLSNFSCGPDSFILSFFKKIMGHKPSLILEIDEHSAGAGVVTRLEAFLESLNNAQVQVDGKPKPIYAEQQTDCSQRTIYIPWMGDAAYALAAAFRGCGQPADVLPLATEETLELGRRFTNGKECLPCIVTTGDMVRRCTEPDFDRNHSAFFMPSGCGPCRFGQYNCLHKTVLDEVGFPDVPVVSPNQDKGFYKDFKQFTGDPTRSAWQGICTIDLLHKTRLALRPYERTPGSVDRVYRECLKELCELLARHADEDQIVEGVADFARRFAAVDVERSDGKPKIGVVGEIYVRHHTFSNNDLVRTLESLGAEVSLASIGEWMYYTNFTRRRTARRERSWREWLRNVLKNRVQQSIERRLAGPFEPLVGHAVEPPIQEILDLAEPYIHDSFEGEAVLSVGKMIEMHHQGCHAAVSVGPFTCMPSTIVAAVMKKMSQDLGGFPLTSISYDGQQDPTLHTRLEAFVHQARAFQNAHSTLTAHA